jgi:hypothetical protein
MPPCGQGPGRRGTSDSFSLCWSTPRKASGCHLTLHKISSAANILKPIAQYSAAIMATSAPTKLSVDGRLSRTAIPRLSVGHLSDYEQNGTDDRTYLIETPTTIQSSPFEDSQ